MGRPRKIVEAIDTDIAAENTVKSSQNSFPVAVIDPSSVTPRILEAYDQRELELFLASGWILFEP